MFLWVERSSRVFPMFTCFHSTSCTIVTRYSHLHHNCCLWIPVCIHTCSLSGRSHSGKMQSEDSCSLCKCSVVNLNKNYLYFFPLFYFLFLDISDGISIDRRLYVVRFNILWKFLVMCLYHNIYLVVFGSILIFSSVHYILHLCFVHERPKRLYAHGLFK